MSIDDRYAIYENIVHNNEMEWGSDEGKEHNLAALYRPPTHLQFHGSFWAAKATASSEGKWLIINVQSVKEFSSHMLNRDTWRNETVSQIISNNFIFWQPSHDSTEGQKVCSYYRVDSVPVVMVIDPITGQKMLSWSGMVQPEILMEELVQFMDASPSEYHATLSRKRPTTASVEIVKDDSESDKALPMEKKKPTYPPLPEEEPKGDEKLVCLVAIRLPDGRRVQRSFLRADPIQLLWSYCSSHLGEADSKLFCFTTSVPGTPFKSLKYDDQITFEKAGIGNSLVSVSYI